MSPKTITEKRQVTFGAFGTTGEDCIGVIEKIFKDENGATFTKFLGCSYLFKGNPTKLDIMAFPKRRALNLLKRANKTPIKILFAFLLLLPRQILERVLMGVIENYLQDVYLPAFRKHINLSQSSYSVSVGELWRVSTLIIGTEFKNARLQNQLFQLRNIGCPILENDFGYRFIWQDALSQVNVDNFRENPIKETKRVFAILRQRITDTKREDASDSTIYKKWRIEKPLIVCFLLSRRLRRLALRFLEELDMEKIGLDDADWYYCLRRDNYNFRGMSLPRRAQLKKQIDRQKGHRIPRVKMKV